MKDLIQIAGIIDEGEARLLLECGVDWLGFPLRVSRPNADLSEEEAARIIRSMEPPACPVLITYLLDAREIRDFCEELGVKTVQLHGDVTPSELARLKELAPDLRIIKSLVVRGDNLGELKSLVNETASLVEAFFTDTYDPATGARGATGKTHDWKISRELVSISPRPVILAGGLNPGNVRQAILEVRPAGVDVHTGVEGKSGRKSRNLVTAFVSEARAGFASMKP